MAELRRSLVRGVLLALVWCAPLEAQRSALWSAGGSEAGGVAHDELRIAPRDGRIVIDGRLDDDGWTGVDPITSFVQGEPVEGRPAEQRAEVRVLFDDEAIYVSARLAESGPARVARQLVRRDEVGQADYFEVHFDPNLDRRTGYMFRITAAGVQSDAYLYADNRRDGSWDAVWESEVAVADDGWTAELRIPWSQIRYASGSGPQTWGVNFVRWRVEAAERTYFALVPRNQHGRVSFFNRMKGVRAPAGLRRIEARPYVLARARTAPAAPNDPFFTGAEASLQTGVDLRYGLGSAFTLDATVNPDFGQVELDPAVINLSAFETYFPERRPFFVEDARVLDFDLSGGRNTLFYSRRIGREPQGRDPDDARFTDVPPQSTILGAGKLTGRTGSGLSVGALAAVTAAEEGRALVGVPGADSVATYLAEPRSQFGVARVQQDLREGSTTVGGIMTAMRRSLPADGSFDFLPSSAYSVGVDFEHMWGEREWALEGFWAGSLVRGAPESMVRIQRSSNHYFQRPDSEFRVDSAATSMAGAEWRLQFERRSGEHWTGSVWLAEVTPGFEVNELGYSRSSERLDGGARVSYQEIEPGAWLRDYRLTASTWHNWRHAALRDPLSPPSWGRAHKGGSVNLNARGTLTSFWGGSVSVSYRPETLSDDATRGGPLMVTPRRYGTDVNIHTDRRDDVVLDAWAGYDDGAAGRSVRGGVGMTVRPAAGWEVRVRPSLGRHRSLGQYVAAFDDPGFEPTHGRRYLFGELDRRSLSLDTRLNVTFTPDLTLQLFARPLVESGHYTAYKQLAGAESFEFTPLEAGAAEDLDGDGVPDRCSGGTICEAGGQQYVDFDGDGVISDAHAFADRDFNLVSLRGNAVLRWEYRPGSTIFLVWQQRRSEHRDFGDFDLGREGSDMLGLQPDNVFIVKLNYWLGV